MADGQPEEEEVSLTLNGLNLTSLPESVWTTRPLHKLWLCENNLASSEKDLLHRVFATLKDLILLDLEENKLTDEAFACLRQFNLDEAERSSLDLDSVSLRKKKEERKRERKALENPFALDSSFSFCRRISLQQEMINKSHCHHGLQVLYLDTNNLTTLPKEIFTFLPSLKWLTAQRNQITEIPTEIRFASELQGLRLCSNRLATIPKEIGQLGKLICLSLSNNNLVCLPQGKYIHIHTYTHTHAERRGERDWKILLLLRFVMCSSMYLYVWFSII